MTRAARCQPSQIAVKPALRRDPRQPSLACVFRTAAVIVPGCDVRSVERNRPFGLDELELIAWLYQSLALAA